jgi:hypothetical protein
VDRIVGLEGVRADTAMMQTPDDIGRLELVKFHSEGIIIELVPWKRDALHKSRSAAPGWQGAKSELIGHK